jgi:hypothetical protein
VNIDHGNHENPIRDFLTRLSLEWRIGGSEFGDRRSQKCEVYTVRTREFQNPDKGEGRGHVDWQVTYERSSRRANARAGAPSGIGNREFTRGATLHNEKADFPTGDEEGMK